MPSLRTQATELKQQRARRVTEGRTILDAAETAGRNLTEEEQTRYGAIMADVRDLGTRAERLEHQATLEDEMETRGEPPRPTADPERRDQPRVLEYRGRRIELTGPNDSDEYRQRFHEFLAGRLEPSQVRALSAGTGTQGGVTLAPTQMVTSILQALDNEVLMRRLGTVLPPIPRAASVGVVSLDADPDDADWTSELQTGSEDSTMAFGKREMHPHPLAKRIKVSNTLLAGSVLNIEDLVQQRLRYKFGVTQEKAGMTGSGAKRWLGVFTASSEGISTGRDVSAGNTNAAMTFDGLTAAKYSLKAPYWMRAQWLFHRDGVKQLAQIKDSEGQYMWRESVRAGEPDILLGRPVNMSEYAPNTFTASQYVGLLGDFSFYWIQDSLSLGFQRLVELYAETNQTGFIGRLESDAQPVLEEAFARVQLAA